MKTLYISDFLYYGQNIDFPRDGTKVFAIGVKNQECSLEKLQEKFGPQLIIERLPEGGNLNYIGNRGNMNILQPAFLSWKEK